MSNKYEFGISRTHVAFIDEEGSDYYETPEEIPGTINISITPESETTEHHHDNKKAGEETNNNGYSGSIETSTIPDEILAEMQGHEIDDNDGIVERQDDEPKEFALMFETEGSDEKIRTVFYRVKAQRPSEEHQTNDPAPNISTKTMDLTMMAEDDSEDKYIKYSLKESDTGFDSFFEEVPMPEFESTSS
ncbi:MAG: major tail protein [Petrotogales bacterium]